MRFARICAGTWLLVQIASASAASPERMEKTVGPLGEVGQSARYLHVPGTRLAASVTDSFILGLGSVENVSGAPHQWLELKATKANGEHYEVWILTQGYPAPDRGRSTEQIARFLFKPGNEPAKEFRDGGTRRCVLPLLADWGYLWPQPADSAAGRSLPRSFPNELHYLGHRYVLQESAQEMNAAAPEEARTFELRPDLLIGLASNTRQRDETRRFDGSEYEYVPLTREDYREMANAGVTCVKVDAKQRPWIDDLSLFYWGVGANDLPFPEGLYDSRYLGPNLFLDEPAVCTRDYVLRPKLEKEPGFRKELTPQIAWSAFTNYFERAWRTGAATSFAPTLAAQTNVDLGDMQLRQEDLFSWETMVSTAAYQLSQDKHVPVAMVFEPPGRVGTQRTLPEIDMTYGCQIATTDPNTLSDIIDGFLRGAARASGKEWGTSVYGAVDRTDAGAFLRRAYDLGATRFFFWDNGQLACVPFHECLALTHQLQMRATDHPDRDLGALRQAAEMAILLPPGYNLGHVQLGKGSLWGLPELNLERRNEHGITYRDVMSNFFTEIERCLRLGVAFDLLTDLPTLPLSGYREVVRVREDGRVEVTGRETKTLLDRARSPERPAGQPPTLTVRLSADGDKAPLRVRAQAFVTQTTAPIYYTFGADRAGVYHNAVVDWELYGPADEDYQSLSAPGLKPQVRKTRDGYEVTTEFTLRRPGKYRLRAATVDLAGRSTVQWMPIDALSP